jgi:hypothetical protein
MFNFVKIFSATKRREYEPLGTRITEWMRSHPEIQIVKFVVRQSSDAQFHCVSFIIFGLTD